MNCSGIKHILAIVCLLLMLMITIVGCSHFNSLPTTLKPDEAQDGTSDSGEADDLKELAMGNAMFTCDLYHQLHEDDNNLFFSPYSISLALAMTYAGARGETEQQMAETLHFTLPQERLHCTFKALNLELAHCSEDAKDFQLHIVNSLWGQEDYRFLPNFLDVLTENYGAEFNLVDFEREPEESRLFINDWVSDQTKGRIQEIIPPGGVNGLTRLTLTNASYFKAAWKYPFIKESTKDGTFNLLDGSKVTVPMMSIYMGTAYEQGKKLERPKANYAQGEGYEALEMLYDNDEISMVILFPEAGNFRKFESMLSGDVVLEILDSLQERCVNHITMPRFSYEPKESFNLAKTLADMGMPLAFNKGGVADFSGMDGIKYLFMENVFHKTFVSVDEAGTEAAAGTAATMVLSAGGREAIDMVIDRPFIYIIRDIETDTILFMGRVMNPIS